jgi:Photosynthetic reaction centre cytochrome C subunit
MTNRALLLFLTLPLCAQTPPDITGVWHCSTPADTLVVITQQGSVYTIKTLTIRTPANTKTVARYDTAADTINWIRGNPTKGHTAWEGSTLRIQSSFNFGGAVQKYQDDWTLTADGKLETVHTQGQAPAKVVFEKQPAEAAAGFDQPEKSAREAYKNVTVLRLPASSVLSMMNVYCYSLGVVCSHCHVNGQWDKDDKPAKATARKMIAMTSTLNKDNFGERTGASCYTCHRGNIQPALVPPE